MKLSLELLNARLHEAQGEPGKGRQLMREIGEALADTTTDAALRPHLEAAKNRLIEYWDGPYVSTYGAKSFKDLAAASAAQESAAEVGELTEQYRQIIGNIMYSDASPADKVSGLRRLSDEFMGLVTTALNVQIETAAPVAGRFSENVSADVVLDAALAEAAEAGARAPLYLNVKLIKPGRGNARDNHFYPADVLKRDASIFEGVDMYTTDHVKGEKSERTKVSKIKEITGFADDGAPIARVVVFDPDFAEKVRNRAAVGELSSLECSILAGGSARAGKCPDGRDGNIVEAITSAQSVDWVTKAGAGGQAVSLAEAAANGETHMQLTEAEKKTALAESGLHLAAQKRLAAGTYADQAALTAAIAAEKAYLAEVEVGTEDLAAIRGMLEKATAALTALEGAVPAVADPPADPPAAVAAKIAAEAVVAELAKSNLPAASKARLAGATYATLAEVNDAVVAEREYIKQATGSGRPVTPRPATAPAEKTLEERATVADEILTKTFGHNRPARSK